jgi:hypothetical protein
MAETGVALKPARCAIAGRGAAMAVTAVVAWRAAIFCDGLRADGEPSPPHLTPGPCWAMLAFM